MKLILSALVYLILGVLLGLGILLAVKGSHWLLIAGLVVYIIAFAKIGCLPGKSH